MALINIGYTNSTIALEPFDNQNPNRRLFVDDVTEQFVWWDDITGIELFRIPSSPNSTGISLTQVADISFVDINALPAVVNPLYTIVGGIPANSILMGIYVDIITPFTSVTRGIDNTAFVDNGGVVPVANGNISAADWLGIEKINLGSSPTKTEKQGVQNFKIKFSFGGGGVNPQDYSTGHFKVYAQYIPFQI